MAQSKKAKYIAQKLTKYFPKKYPSYTSALPEAKLVYAQIQDAGEKVNLKSIFSKVRTPRLNKPMALEFILKSKGWKEMQTINHYFDLLEFQQYLLNCPNNLGFESKLLPKTTKQPVMGGSGKNYTYETLFGPYIGHINKMKSLTKEEDERYQSDWLIKITMPKNKGKIFVSQVISVDINGQEMDYGFDPSEPGKEITEPILSGAEVPEQEARDLAEPTAPSPKREGLSADQEFLLKMETLKTEKIKEMRGLIADLKELGYTPAQIKEQLDKL